MIIDHPSRDEELEIVRRHGHRSAMPRLEDFDIKPVANSAMLAAARPEKFDLTSVRLFASGADAMPPALVEQFRKLGCAQTSPRGWPLLTAAFADGEDIHAAVASQVFGVAPEEVTVAQRSTAKMVSYGLAYGMEAFGLSQRLNVPVEEAQLRSAEAAVQRSTGAHGRAVRR